MKELLVNPERWGAIAADYDATARQMLTPFSAEALHWAELAATDRVLDVACGPGTTTVLAAPHVESVHAIDFAPEMIAQLERNVSDRTNVTVTVGDGQHLSLPDEQFTAAFSMFGLMFFPDPVAGLRELHRVLEPGGRVVISSWVPMTRSPMMQPLAAAMRHAVSAPPDQPPPEPFAFDSVESLVQGLRDGGFVEVEAREFAPELPVGGGEQYWANARGNLFVRDARERAGAAWAGIEARALEYLRQSLDSVETLAMPGLIARGWKR